MLNRAGGLLHTFSRLYVFYISQQDVCLLWQQHDIDSCSACDLSQHRFFSAELQPSHLLLSCAYTVDYSCLSVAPCSYSYQISSRSFSPQSFQFVGISLNSDLSHQKHFKSHSFLSFGNVIHPLFLFASRKPKKTLNRSRSRTHQHSYRISFKQLVASLKDLYRQKACRL